MTTTATRLDTLDIISLKQPGFNLSGAYTVRQGDDHNGFLFLVKNPVGHPIDVIRYDDNFLYDNSTEVNWDDAAYIKFHIANGGRGIKIGPRYINLPFSGSQLVTVSDDDSPFVFIKDGQCDFVPHSVLATKHIWYAPVVRSMQGDVGNIPVWQRDFFWDGRLVPGHTGLIYDTKETYEYGFDLTNPTKRSFGLLRWFSYKLDNGGNWVKADGGDLSNKLRKFATGESATLVKLPFMSGMAT